MRHNPEKSCGTFSREQANAIAISSHPVRLTKIANRITIRVGASAGAIARSGLSLVTTAEL